MIVCYLGLSLTLIITSSQVVVVPTVEVGDCKNVDLHIPPPEPSKDSNARIVVPGPKPPKQ